VIFEKDGFALGENTSLGKADDEMGCDRIY
jgi:hypothetical protein